MIYNQYLKGAPLELTGKSFTVTNIYTRIKLHLMKLHTLLDSTFSFTLADQDKR